MPFTFDELDRARRRIAALQKKTVENGCTPEEAESAKQLVTSLTEKYFPNNQRVYGEFKPENTIPFETTNDSEVPKRYVESFGDYDFGCRLFGYEKDPDFTPSTTERLWIKYGITGMRFYVRVELVNSEYKWTHGCYQNKTHIKLKSGVGLKDFKTYMWNLEH